MCSSKRADGVTMLLLSTLLVGIVSALCPVVNLEVYVAGIGAIGKNFGLWSVAIAAAIGQTLGKLAWYQAGSSSMKWPFIARKMESPKWSGTFERVRTQFERRRWTGIVMVFLSSTIGLPPLAIMSVLCGQLRFGRVSFAAMVFLGRAARFATVLGGTSWLARGI